jgi:glycosyltransferase involved in cell wall biosynthesis
MTRPLTIALADEVDGPGGAEVLVLQLGEELRRRGHRVVPILPKGKTGWLAERFSESGFQPESFRIRGPLDSRLPGELTEILRRRGVDVLHSHEFTMAVYGAAAAGRIGIPHVITMHGNQTMTAALRRRVALRWAFRSSQAVSAVSRDTHRHLAKTLGITEGAIVTIPNGIPERRGDPASIRSELRLRSDEVLLLAVGSLQERKGHAVLLDALARLQPEARLVPWRLVIAGTGPEMQRLQDRATALGVADRVVLAGYRSDIPALQAAADIFVMPSLWEGLPLAILEAMFASNPVLATRTSGIPEAIDHGKEGLLVPPGDVEAHAAALSRLLLERELRKRLGAAGRNRALREFTIERMASDYEALYRGAAPPGKSDRRATAATAS